MTILYSERNKAYKYPKRHDTSDKKIYPMDYRPQTWEAGLEVIKGFTLLIPTVSAGMMYECVSGGLTGGTEPTWGAVEDGLTEDGSASFKAVPLDCLLAEGDVITDSTWEGPVGATIDTPLIITGTTTKFRLTAVPPDTKSVTIVNHIKVTRLNGELEEFDSSLIIPIGAL